MQEEAAEPSQQAGEPLEAVGNPDAAVVAHIAVGIPAVEGSPDREGVGEAASSFSHNGFSN